MEAAVPSVQTAPPSAFSPAASTAFSPCSSRNAMSPAPVGDHLGDLLMPLSLGGQQFPLGSPPSAHFGASPFGVSTKSVTHSTGVNEHGQRFTQQHYTVNTQEWYTPLYAQNGSGGGATRVWKPEITANTEMSKFQHSAHNVGADVPYKVSLEHSHSTVPPKGFNSAALPFNADPRVKHLQYNSPMGLYSSGAAAEQYAQQTAGIVSHDSSVGRPASEQPSYLRSETLRLLKEQEAPQNGFSSSLSSHPNPHGLPVCYVCTRPILGVMAQAAGHPLHGDCLSCSTCGSSLKNVGHHFLDGKFYCDIHARLKRATSGGPQDRRSAAPSTRPSEPRAVFPSEPVRRPLSVSPAPNHSLSSLSYSVSNPKTQGAISPANRGVPTSQMYGADLNRSASRAASTAPPSDYRPVSVSLAPPPQTAPPPPSNPPPATAYSTRNSTQQRSETAQSGALTQQTLGGKVPFCEACGQQIRGAFVLAQGLSWCPEHFICANAACGRRLLECGFVEENGQKFCEACFENNIAPRCAKCTQPIISDCLNALQKKWHPQCFTCAHCSKPFGNSAFYLEQGLPYCESDWNRLFTTKCYQCTYPIEAGDRWVEALGHAYHSNCFNCTRCNVNLEGESFYAKNGDPFCKLHA